MKKMKKITAILIIGVLPLLSANAAGVKEVSPGLFVQDYSGQELISKGCDPINWNKLVADYVAKRTAEKMVEKAQIDQIIKSAPKAQGAGLEGKAGACFQSAIGQIDNAINTANSLLSILDGTFDFSALATSLINKYAEQACQQVDYVVGAQVNRALSPLTNGLSTISTTLNGLNVSGVPVVSTAVTPSTTGYQPPYLAPTLPPSNSSQTWTEAAQTTAKVFFSKVNPFKSDVQNVPDPLK